MPRIVSHPTWAKSRASPRPARFSTPGRLLSNARVKMNDPQKMEQSSSTRDQEIRAALDQHWAASDANDFETEHLIYREDAVLEYPQSGELTRGRRNIQGQRANQPSKKRFT